VLSLGGFVLFYSALAVVEVWLMLKYIRLGPQIETFPRETPDPLLIA
jgi:cytochrome d ubiquinol oxidase subunit I